METGPVASPADYRNQVFTTLQTAVPTVTTGTGASLLNDPDITIRGTYAIPVNTAKPETSGWKFEFLGSFLSISRNARKENYPYVELNVDNENRSVKLKKT